MAWTDLDETIAAAQSGHITDHQQIHGYLNDWSNGTYGMLNVADYNVLPANSAATNSTNIATAIAAMANGDTLFFPKGVYDFSSTIEFPSTLKGIRVLGSGGRGRDPSGGNYGTTLRMDNAVADTLMFYNGGTVSVVHEGPIFENLNFSVENETTENGIHTLLHIRNTNNWTVTRCTFSYGYIGLKTDYTNDNAWNRVDDCKFFACNRGADITTGPITWTGCHFVLTGQYKSGIAVWGVYLDGGAAAGTGHSFFGCHFVDQPVYIKTSRMPSFFGCLFESQATLSNDFKQDRSGENVYAALTVEGTGDTYSTATRGLTVLGCLFDGASGAAQPNSSHDVGIWLKSYVRGALIAGNHFISYGAVGPYGVSNQGPDYTILNDSGTPNGLLYQHTIIGNSGDDGGYGSDRHWPVQLSPSVITVAGAVTDSAYVDGDTYVPDGTIGLDESNERLYIKTGGAWKYITIDNGL